MRDRDRESTYRAVARLHAENIDQGFLPKLGLTFMALLYRAIDESPESTLILAHQDNQICGFIAGTIDLKKVYLRLLYHWPALVAALAPSLFVPARLCRIIEILRYSGGDRAEMPCVALPRAELLSIAVAPGFRGRGHADSLYGQLRHFFDSQGQSDFKIVVGADLWQAHRFYQRMGAVPTGHITLHRGTYSTVYLQACPNAGGQRPALSKSSPQFLKIVPGSPKCPEQL